MSLMQVLADELGRISRRLSFRVQDKSLEVTWESGDIIWTYTNSAVAYAMLIIIEGDELLLNESDGYNFRGRDRFKLSDPKSIDTLVRVVEDWIEDNEADTALNENDD